MYAYVNGTHHLDNIDGNARSYDANGNTTLNPDTLSSTFTYDDRNRLEVMSGSPQGLYRYNARGERLIKQWGFMNFGLKERVSSYDEQGKLVAYLDYEYDNRGRRLLKGSYATPSTSMTCRWPCSAKARSATWKPITSAPRAWRWIR